MKTLKLLILLFVFFFGDSQGMTDDEMREEFMRITMICSKDNQVDMKDLLSLQQLNVPTKKDVKCLLACAYKKTGSMNKEGLYDIEASYKIAEMTKNGDPKRLENAKKLVDICAKERIVSIAPHLAVESLSSICGVSHANRIHNEAIHRMLPFGDIMMRMKENVVKQMYDKRMAKNYKVNDETVSDGEAGCDRAGLIFKCVVENAPKLGFKLK